MQKSRDLRVRSFQFAVDVVAFCRAMSKEDSVLRRLSFQLVDSAGSVGANLEEAARAQSKRDFIAKNCIAPKEARESRFWLKVISSSEPSLAARTYPLTTESTELVKMLVAAVKTARSNPHRGPEDSAAM